VNDATNDETREPDDGRTEPTVEIEAIEQELLKLRRERDELEQKLQRAMADTANIRRRQQQEMADSRRRTLEGLTQELLPALDSFRFALQAYDQDAETHGDAAQRGEQQPGQHVQALVDGVRMVQTLLASALERHGLSEIPAEGQPFDPARHEAVAVEPRDDVTENHVVRVLQTGYMLGEHVVRHSKVIVAGPKTDS
jgi:molecular chaperone GrpE